MPLAFHIVLYYKLTIFDIKAEQKTMAISMWFSSATAANLCRTHFQKHPSPSFPVNICLPPTKLNLQQLLCAAAAAESQTGPVKKANRKKRKGKNESSSNSVSKSKSKPKSVKEVSWSDVDVEIVDDDYDNEESSNDGSFGYSTAPLPKPPAGFVVDDTGRVLMASNKRIATIVSSLFCKSLLLRFFFITWSGTDFIFLIC